MKIVVTGGTGFVGTPLVRSLVADGCDVTVVTRDVARTRPHLPVRCRAASWQDEDLRDALRHADGVLHLAGEGVADGRWTTARRHAIRESRIGSTRALVRSMTALGAGERPRVLLSASAIGYYGNRGDEPLDENSGPGAGFLADVCEAWETEARGAAEVGVHTTALRIGIVLGHQGGAFARMLPPFRMGLGGRLGSGTQWMSWIHLHDLVALARFALGQPGIPATINAVAPGAVRNDTFTRTLAEALGRPAFLPVPGPVLRLALGEMSDILLASQLVRPEAATRAGFAFRYPELSGALADLCAHPAHEIEHEQWIPRPPAEVFAFFSDPYNLERITPDFLRFQVLRTSTRTIEEGTRIDYRLSLHGLPVRWQSAIEQWHPGVCFVDVQTRGPYKLWRHTHEFEPHAGGTLVRDRVQYELPFGAPGDLAGHRMVSRDLEAIFAHRRRRLAEILC